MDSKENNIKDFFIMKMEEQILSGLFPIGSKLPPEREIAENMGISRIIVHSGLVELAAKGIIMIKPRVGAFVNDYKKEGNLNVFESISRQGDMMDPKIAESLTSLRYILETENARLAALKRNEDDLKSLERILKEEAWLEEEDFEKMTELDFKFHHKIAISTKNILYPAIIKSLEPIYKKYVRDFYTGIKEHEMVFSFHKELYTAILNQAEAEAATVMDKILRHGERVMKELKIY